MLESQRMLADLVGWVYFLAWSLSFYGQVYENHKHKRYPLCQLA
jgi:hypothetical protein